MLSKDNVFHVSREGYKLLTGPKKNVSRALRRFLAESCTGVSPVTERMLLVSYAFNQGHSVEQLGLLETYAQEQEVRAREYLKEGGAHFRSIIRDDDFQSVFSQYELAWSPATATLKQLQAMVKAVVVLSDCMHQYAAFPNENALAACPMYVYRGYACDIAPTDQIWCVVGVDNNGGGSGVLEWCYDEEDAQFILRRMNHFPERFENLEARPFREAIEPVAA